MRLISGVLGGRRLETANDAGLRPAMALTRESLFSMLESMGADWPRTRVLDLFAGCGSLGFECLSRGAMEAHFVENGAKPHACLLNNASALGVNDRARIWRMDVRRFLRGSFASPFDIIFLDPPYRRNYAPSCLFSLVNNGWLSSGALILAELEKDLQISAPPGLGPVQTREFGQTCVHIWKSI